MPGNGISAAIDGRVSGKDGFDGDPGLGLEFDATHPDDAAVQFEDGPKGSAGSCNSETFKDFFHFAGAAGVAQRDSITRLPIAELDGASGGDSLPFSLFG